MVIVGTHMDLMKEQQSVKELEEYTLKKYTGSKDTNHIYPKVTYIVYCIHVRGSSFFLGKSDCLGCAVLLCLVCLFALACFFLSSFSSLI